MTRRTKGNADPEAEVQGVEGPTSGEAPDFETSMRRLEEIVRELESGDVPLEKAMQLFEEGVRLGSTCRRQLDAAQARVDKLLERADGSAEAQPFEPAP
jgi:exodeoxyribonuclease VII small subunit